MTHPDRLAQVAAQLAARVRDDDPDANARWLAGVLPDPADWFRLTFMLAAAVPVDRTWAELTRWTQPDSPETIQARRQLLDAALHGRAA